MQPRLAWSASPYVTSYKHLRHGTLFTGNTADAHHYGIYPKTREVNITITTCLGTEADVKGEGKKTNRIA